MEHKRVNLNTKGCNIFLFELAGQVALYKCRFSNSTVSNENEFELGNILLLSLCNEDRTVWA